MTTVAYRGPWWVVGVVVGSLALYGCGASSDADNATNAPIAAVLQSDNGQLSLPLVRSGSDWYSAVRMRLASDGSFTVVEANRREAPGGTADAVIDPPIDPLALPGNSNETRMTIRRVHLGERVVESLVIVFQAGKWHYLNDPVEATGLTIKDFAANNALAANHTHVVALSSEPAIQTQRFPVQLQSQTYRLCADPQDEGADELAMLDQQGAVLAAVKAGAACVPVRVVQGAYQLRHSYGGAGSRRTVFVSHRVSNSAMGAARPVLAAARDSQVHPTRWAFNSIADPLGGPNNPEYWALSVQATPALAEPHFLTFRSLADIDPGIPYGPPSNVDSCAGYFDLAGRTGTWDRMNPTKPQSRTLADGMSLFRVFRDANGNASGLGPPRYCDTDPQTPNPVYNWRVPNGDGHPVNLYPNHQLSDPSKPTATGPARLEFASATGGTLHLVAPADATGAVPGPLYFTLLSGDNLFNASLNGSQVYGYFSSGGGIFSAPIDFQVGLRYFPSGLANTGLYQGQIALFKNSTCSGEALVVDNLNLPKTAMVGFTGSILLGQLTKATVYGSENYTGTAKNLFSAGCNMPNMAFSSMRMSVDTSDIVLQHNACEYCNLGGIDLSNHDMTGARLTHSNLVNAIFTKTNLSNADLSYANLASARLDLANLDGANLKSAAGNAPPSGGAAASLQGAYLRNANLAGSNFSAADFTFASFYSSNAGTCQIWNSSSPNCSSASGATLDGAVFSSALLSGTDFSGTSTSARGAVFTAANLAGAVFASADLSANESSGRATLFDWALLMGADFTGAKVKQARFSNAYVSPPDAQSGNCILQQLDNHYTGFAGFKVPNSQSTGPACVLGKQDAPTCIQTNYSKATVLPTTDCTNVCPDGSTGSIDPNSKQCTTNFTCSGTWSNPLVKLDGSAIGTCDPNKPPSWCADAFSINNCW